MINVQKFALFWHAQLITSSKMSHIFNDLMILKLSQGVFKAHIVSRK